MTISVFFCNLFDMKPRKLSKLLRITSKYHKGWGGNCKGMCHAAGTACAMQEITKEEKIRVQLECEKLVDQYGRGYLCEGLGDKMNLEGDIMGYCRLVYEAWIDKLESEGK